MRLPSLAPQVQDGALQESGKDPMGWGVVCRDGGQEGQGAEPWGSGHLTDSKKPSLRSSPRAAKNPSEIFRCSSL